MRCHSRRNKGWDTQLLLIPDKPQPSGAGAARLVNTGAGTRRTVTSRVSCSRYDRPTLMPDSTFRMRRVVSWRQEDTQVPTVIKPCSSLQSYTTHFSRMSTATSACTQMGQCQHATLYQETKHVRSTAQQVPVSPALVTRAAASAREWGRLGAAGPWRTSPPAHR